MSLATAGIMAIQSPAQATPQPIPIARVSIHTITLVTGDVVTLTTLADGKQVAEVDRPDSATGGARLLQSGGDLYVVPDEALSLLRAGKLDRRLFNVTDLVEMGYDDAKTKGVPLIATFAPSRARAADPVAPRGSTIRRNLSSIRGASLNADKRQARSFWTAIVPAAQTQPTTLASGVSALWLDGKVKAALAESVPQIGAPQAWAAGYDGTGVTVAVLDTGVDATHPDLVGQIDTTVSFVPGEDTSDVNGHGTHVASTIAGTGAASGGANKGVAPGADLIVGKVLGNDGYGQDSWTLAGMQWAAETGADVVSMSLGDSIPTDGSDPMSMAVDALSQQYGTLFVVAAGNAGPETISAPAAAREALTVGAVDKQDALAYFSTTGPVSGSGALKPDLTAPGVDINAARSSQSGGEGPYVGMSGTSMATPHVSGAAAILAQRHPDWTRQQLKDALMSSAHGLADSYTPYEVGTGRVDVAAAVTNTVFSTGSAFFGNFDWPHEPSDAPVTKPVTFANSGPSAVTVNLSLVGTGPFSLGASSVTVPAGGSVDVPVTGDPTVAGFGRFTSYLVGTDAATGNAVTRTSLGLIKEEERYNLTVRLRDRLGKAASGFVVVNKAGEFYPYLLNIEGDATVRLPAGTYTVETAIDVTGERSDGLGLAVLTDPEVILDRATEVVLDARQARRLETTAPVRTEDRQRKIDFQVTYQDGSSYRSAYVLPVMYDDLYVSPTDAMTTGSFELATRWRKGEPMLSLRALGWLGFGAVVQPGSTLTAGTQRLPAVYAGTGAASAYAKLKAKGKVVVVTRSDEVSPTERAAAAAAAGARLLVVVNDGAGILNEYVGETPIPVATVHRN
jgi:subtilisin family serine protease